MSETQLPTSRTRVVREADRAVYDRDAVYRILDEGFLCHVGFVVDGQPFVIPTSYGREGDSLYIHGSAASRMLRQMKEGVPVCVTVTLLDGLVLARSVFNHSMNYRSVVILGKGTPVEDAEEKLAALRVLSEHILPGRWDDARQPNERELKATSVLRVPIEEFSAKVRTGPPVDDTEDHAFPTWAGVVPLEMKAGVPIDDPGLDPMREVPEYVKNYSRQAHRLGEFRGLIDSVARKGLSLLRGKEVKMTRYSSTISSKGQVTVPQEIRNRLGLTTGDRVDFVIEGERTVIRPARDDENPFAKYRGVLGPFEGGEKGIKAWIDEMRNDENDASRRR